MSPDDFPPPEKWDWQRALFPWLLLALFLFSVFGPRGECEGPVLPAPLGCQD